MVFGTGTAFSRGVPPTSSPPRSPASGPAATRRAVEAARYAAAQPASAGGRDDPTVLVARPLPRPDPIDSMRFYAEDRELRAERRRRRGLVLFGALLAVALAAFGTWRLAVSMNGGGAAASVYSSAR